MNYDKSIVYFVPGMAAGSEIFNNIRFPESQYEIRVLEWLIPEKNESLTEYAYRMSLRIKDPNAILIGVSFGGVVVQEMSQFLSLKKLIIISSVKNRFELPRRMKIAAWTKLYKLAPTSLVLIVEDLTKFSIGPKSKKRLAMYQQYLHVRDRQYLRWALEKMVTWDREEEIPGVVHIHGEKDSVFPIKYISHCKVIPKGTHIMILNRGREISQLLLQIFNQTA
ncbi:alpha/beta hydrolase [Aequorivita sp. H23M31]|uniref:Alpha/beta hydrolase n=1 Tax=Aequorivita ciconiae TaxID=2494375 RepID=A0A410G751_9FLAO|nr:alpha/beta hydrolase [Aequorivita sp. H23M31]QAA83051.1 alpha/beta hydrolase [Aequorivita sp. H23M31]